MKDTLGYEESRPLQNEGYLQERRVKLRDNAGVLRIPTTSDKEGNGSNGYASGLLEKIFDRGNLNAAYRKVKENKRVLSLIRKHLKSGVMINGVVMET